MTSSNAASGDLPDYLKSKFTKIHSLGQDKKQPKGKSILPELRAGVSADAPSYFQTSFIKSVDSSLRNKCISGRDEIPDRFLSQLKQNRVAEKPKFLYQDFDFNTEKKLYDYDTLKPSEILDLNAGTRPDIKTRDPYYKNYFDRLRTSAGFGLNRGEFTVRAMQPSVERYRISKLSMLKNHKQTLNYSTRKCSPEKPKEGESCSRLNASSVFIELEKPHKARRLKKIHQSVDFSQDQELAKRLTEDIKAFEGRIESDSWGEGKSPHKLYTTSYKIIQN